MKPIACIIVDDEQPAIDVLSHYIQKTPHVDLAYTTTNPLEALDFVRRKETDNLQDNPRYLIFLDIHMPQLSGIEFLQLAGKQHPVILTTAYSEYALQGFEYEVVDYLLKPIAFQRFLKAVQRIDRQQKPIPIKEVVPASTKADFLLVKMESKGKLIKVNMRDIVYVEGLKNYISIYTENERIITLLTMKELEEKLPNSEFCRVHKSYIVALDRISTIDGNQIFLKSNQLKNLPIPLGATYRQAFFNFLEGNMGNKPN